MGREPCGKSLLVRVTRERAHTPEKVHSLAITWHPGHFQHASRSKAKGLRDRLQLVCPVRFQVDPGSRGCRTVGRNKISPVRFPRRPPPGPQYRTLMVPLLALVQSSDPRVQSRVQATLVALVRLSVRSVQHRFRLDVSGMFPAPSLTFPGMSLGCAFCTYLDLGRCHMFRPRNGLERKIGEHHQHNTQVLDETDNRNKNTWVLCVARARRESACRLTRHGWLSSRRGDVMSAAIVCLKNTDAKAMSASFSQMLRQPIAKSAHAAQRGFSASRDFIRNRIEVGTHGR